MSRKRQRKKISVKPAKKKHIASVGGLTLHQIGGSLKGFRQRLAKLCNHPRRPQRI